MRLHSDVEERIVLNANDLRWVDSPAPGVERKMFERFGREQGWATSLVRYAPGSEFPMHAHSAGEEIFVISGVLSDASGDHAAGCYLRNAPGSRHAPYSTRGCQLLVKLNQFSPGDKTALRIDTNCGDWLPGLVDGLTVLPLHAFGTENTALVRWEPGTTFNRHRHWGGEEIFVLEGMFEDEHGTYPVGSWLRSPHLSEHTPFSEAGCLILVKTGHLNHRNIRDSALHVVDC